MNILSKYFSIKLLIIILLGMILTSSIAYAQFGTTEDPFNPKKTQTTKPGTDAMPEPRTDGMPEPRTDGMPEPTGLPSPTPAFSNICDLINAVIKVVAQLGSLVGILFIIWSGFLFIKAQGNPEELGRAKRTFYTTIIGLAILLGASAITSIIFNTVSSITTAGGAASICPASTKGSGSYESAGGSF